jgi:hypothetical protein
LSKTRKIDKEFVITDDSVNCYGFRLLTEGYLIGEYKKNPIGYAMHKRDDGVLVRWEDLRVDGNTVYGKPVINLNHAMGQRTVDEINDGFLNAASVGHIVVLELSEEASLKLDGQTGPTITKWFNRECSLVDVPGNYNALKQLFDADDQPIQNLSDFTKSKLSHTMKQVFFTGAQIAAMNLKADASEIEIGTAFNDLVAKAAKSAQLETELNNLKAQTTGTKVNDLIAAAEAAGKITKEAGMKLKADYANNPEGLKNLLDLIAAPAGTKVSDLIAAAQTAGKITVETGKKLSADYASNPEGLKNLLDAMPVYQSITNDLNAKGGDKKFANLMAKSWDELFETGETEVLKKEAPELYAQKYKETFGKDPK